MLNLSTNAKNNYFKMISITQNTFYIYEPSETRKMMSLHQNPSPNNLI